ncbi:hypothetical protein M3Y98_00714800 [Aphelenchoides besseyi]|nr:hypothetical protein M3Y98_00714800 [Aphelenchoides besseyi]
MKLSTGVRLSPWQLANQYYGGGIICVVFSTKCEICDLIDQNDREEQIIEMMERMQVMKLSMENEIKDLATENEKLTVRIENQTFKAENSEELWKMCCANTLTDFVIVVDAIKIEKKCLEILSHPTSMEGAAISLALALESNDKSLEQAAIDWANENGGKTLLLVTHTMNALFKFKSEIFAKTMEILRY